MKTILISGCSYCTIFDESKLKKKLQESFEVDEVINISKSGCSIDRQIKAVVEWLSKNKKPELIILPITHETRYDESVRKYVNSLNDYDQSLCVCMDPFQNQAKLNESFPSRFGINLINDLLKTKTIIYNNISSFSNLLTKIITFSGWLKSIKIRHLIFDMCNNFDSKKYANIQKQIFLKDNKNIIDIFNFCGNNFIFENVDKDKLNWKNIDQSNKSITHYDAEDNLKLIDYLKTYILKNNI